jgi:hypothetical protein
MSKHDQHPSKKNKKRILFICKKRHVYGETEKGANKLLKSSGLYNSAKFVSDMLNENCVESKIVDVVDNNSIDKEVTIFKPDFVIIEALWVVPEKFEVLTKLHPKVKWIIRLHSEIPFLSNEGIAIDWLYKYIKYKNVHVGANSTDAFKIINDLLKNEKTYYLPNYYPLGDNKCNTPQKNDNIIHIGCFGAIRPLKNQLQQAIAAIDFANETGKSLHYHINSERIEGRGEPILHNIRALFKNNPKHKLIEYAWLNHEEFIQIVKKMDIGMQVSFSETFNIVTADLVSNNIPVVVSPEVTWVSSLFKADPNSNSDIVKKLHFVWNSKILNLKSLNLWGLKKYNKESTKVWLNYFKVS